MEVFVAFAIIVLGLGVVYACLNSNALLQRFNEFKETYLTQASTPPPATSAGDSVDQLARDDRDKDVYTRNSSREQDRITFRLRYRYLTSLTLKDRKKAFQAYRDYRAKFGIDTDPDVPPSPSASKLIREEAIRYLIQDPPTRGFSRVVLGIAKQTNFKDVTISYVLTSMLEDGSLRRIPACGGSQLFVANQIPNFKAKPKSKPKPQPKLLPDRLRESKPIAKLAHNTVPIPKGPDFAKLVSALHSSMILQKASCVDNALNIDQVIFASKLTQYKKDDLHETLLYLSRQTHPNGNTIRHVCADDGTVKFYAIP